MFAIELRQSLKSARKLKPNETDKWVAFAF